MLVKSVDLDSWTDEQLQNMIRWGNKRANRYWEAKLRPGSFLDEEKIETFIRTKYELKRWAREGGIPEDLSILDENNFSITESMPVGNASASVFTNASLNTCLLGCKPINYIPSKSKNFAHEYLSIDKREKKESYPHICVDSELFATSETLDILECTKPEFESRSSLKSSIMSLYNTNEATISHATVQKVVQKTSNLVTNNDSTGLSMPLNHLALINDTQVKEPIVQSLGFNTIPRSEPSAVSSFSFISDLNFDSPSTHTQSSKMGNQAHATLVTNSHVSLYGGNPWDQSENKTEDDSFGDFQGSSEDKPLLIVPISNQGTSRLGALDTLESTEVWK